MLQRSARGLLRVLGWRIDGVIPPHPKMVVIGAPHTSNWDFPLAMLAAPALGVRIRWLGKHTIFRRPFGWFFRMLGGIPVDRSRAAGVVDQTVAAFAAARRLVLVITPEGTRSRRSHWKAGFYRIAVAAAVPLVLVGIDGATKTIRVGPSLELHGDVAAEMDRIRLFFTGHGGLKPDRVGPIRLRDENR